jgi:hypothetical protein
MHRDPFYNFIYGGLTRNAREAAQAAQFLRALPQDLVNHKEKQTGAAAYAGPPRPVSAWEESAVLMGDPFTKSSSGQNRTTNRRDANICWVNHHLRLL